jgi:hypothetical protein
MYSTNERNKVEIVPLAVFFEYADFPPPVLKALKERYKPRSPGHPGLDGEDLLSRALRSNRALDALEATLPKRLQEIAQAAHAIYTQTLLTGGYRGSTPGCTLRDILSVTGDIIRSLSHNIRQELGEATTKESLQAWDAFLGLAESQPHIALRELVTTSKVLVSSKDNAPYPSNEG